jgi:hypothetical protein
MGHSDDDAVRKIEVTCQEKCPDITEAEIIHFIEEHGPRFARMKSLNNPMGVLIRHLPKCFEGESFQLYRRSETMKREELRKTWQSIFDDPDTDPETKKLAQEWLASEGS